MVTIIINTLHFFCHLFVHGKIMFFCCLSMERLTKGHYFYKEVPGDGLGVSLFLIIEANISDSLFLNSLFPNIVILFIKLTRYI